MTTIPHVKSPTDDTGLTAPNGGIIYLVWKVKGKVRRKSLRTEDWTEARKLRDYEFKEMARKGARTIESKTPREKILANPQSKLYVIQRKPYFVKIGKDVIGEADSREEAIKIRNTYLKIK